MPRFASSFLTCPLLRRCAVGFFLGERAILAKTLREVASTPGMKSISSSVELRWAIGTGDKSSYSSQPSKEYFNFLHCLQVTILLGDLYAFSIGSGCLLILTEFF